MLESFPVAIAAGTVLGFLSGIGVGGGSLLILWLTAVLGMSQDTARGINLLFFLPCALVACLFRWKEGTIDVKKILPAIGSGCLSALLFSWVGSLLHPETLKKIFGFLFLLTGLRELLWKQKKTQR